MPCTSSKLCLYDINQISYAYIFVLVLVSISIVIAGYFYFLALSVIGVILTIFLLYTTYLKMSVTNSLTILDTYDPDI